jgi:hypothetical protein
LYAPAVMLGTGILAWGFPQDAVRLVSASDCPRQNWCIRLDSSCARPADFRGIGLTADVLAGRGLPNAFRRALLTGCRQRPGISEEGQSDEKIARQTHRDRQ